jgi:hypothetical protein
MVVYELSGTEASNDWASRGQTVRIGLYSTPEKAQAKIDSIKKDKRWRMDWTEFTVSPVEVK